MYLFDNDYIINKYLSSYSIIMASEDGNLSSIAEYKNRSLIAVHVIKKVYYIRRKVLTATNFLQKIIDRAWG